MIILFLTSLNCHELTSEPYVCTTWQSMRKEMSKSRARTDADLAEGEEGKILNVSISFNYITGQQGKKFPHWNMSFLYLNSHPSPLMCLGNSLSLGQKKKTLQDMKHLAKNPLPRPTGVSSWVNTATLRICHTLKYARKLVCKSLYES